MKFIKYTQSMCEIGISHASVHVFFYMVFCACIPCIICVQYGRLTCTKHTCNAAIPVACTVYTWQMGRVPKRTLLPISPKTLQNFYKSLSLTSWKYLSSVRTTIFCWKVNLSFLADNIRNMLQPLGCSEGQWYTLLHEISWHINLTKNLNLEIKAMQTTSVMNITWR